MLGAVVWRRLVQVDQVLPGCALPCDPEGPAGPEVVVWRTVGGRVVAMDARCPHQWSHLGVEGVVDGDELVCASHFWRFSPEGVGTKVNVHGRRDPKADIAVHPVRERDGWVEADLPPPDRRGTR
ncbi:MAG: Rieske 2Fe-2S domain-containing protein [Acidimicrobiales bacterium]|jgi:nitrite reductase/ring-hydroxylating ferredoxin subunit|nr:Rieske 2Fe-2S domain-containing protein [Acidimicrobiales bacterium]